MSQSNLEQLHEWLDVVQSEFAEMPGLRLSKRQAQRLWNLDSEVADALFDALEATHFLRRTDKGMYTRIGVGC